MPPGVASQSSAAASPTSGALSDTYARSSAARPASKRATPARMSASSSASSKRRVVLAVSVMPAAASRAGPKPSMSATASLHSALPCHVYGRGVGGAAVADWVGGATEGTDDVLGTGAVEQTRAAPSTDASICAAASGTPESGSSP